MRKIHLDSAKPGDVLAKPIWSSNGSSLIGVGVQLNHRYIERLKVFGVDSVYIQDHYTADLFPEEAIRDETRKKAVQTVYNTMVGLTRSSDVKGKSSVPQLGQTFQNVFNEIIFDLTNRTNLMISLSDLREKEGYLFHHSVNVSILSGIMGIAKGYNRSQMLELGVGALLFDIGMTVFPEQLWQKSTAFTLEQRQRMNRHTDEGFNLLRKQFDVSLLSAHCALQHHERYDGSGYPRGLKGDEIHEYAQIIAIADVYDALISPRTHRKAYSPSEAIEFLYANGNKWFDLELIKIFCNHIAIYPIASTVLLSTGQVGVVSAFKPHNSNRPTVRIIQEADGTPAASAYEIDLAKQVNITIAKTL